MEAVKDIPYRQGLLSYGLMSTVNYTVCDDLNYHGVQGQNSTVIFYGLNHQSVKQYLQSPGHLTRL
jgi:hypothetical protein